MPSSTDLAQRIWNTFTQSTPELRKIFLNNLETNPSALALEPGEQPIRLYSDFEPGDKKRVKRIADKFARLAASAPDEITGISNALDEFDRLKGRENPEILFTALRTFLIHYKGSVQFAIPSLLVREPEIVAPSRQGTPDLGFAIGSTDEAKLDWFRESPTLNEHHEHWHTVYDTRLEFDRQGEMFFYMHQQMLARYDCERIAGSVSRVVPFDNMQALIPVGYAAGPDERLAGFIDRDRPVNERVNGQQANQQRAWISAIRADVSNGRYDPTGNTMKHETDAVNRLGSTIESNENPQTDRTRPYLGYHGAGHVFIASINEGVMRTTVTAVRDVIFWEWHKGIDDIYFTWQEKLAPNNFATQQPRVMLRKGLDSGNRPYSMDIILCETSDIPGSGQAGFDGDALGIAAFGGANWPNDFESGNFSFTDTDGQTKNIKTTNQLHTRIENGSIRYVFNGQQNEYEYDYIHHIPFSYFLRLENSSLQVQKVTIRIYMVPVSHAEDRRMWIEMDKFLYELPSSSQNVIYRSDTQSSVIRKPAVLDPATHLTVFDPTQIPGGDRICDCGWPYHMLLPKGISTGEGMEFRLMVMVTDANIDLIEKEEDCGSFSFCAARSTDYPDRRPLGYPFNRKFTGAGTTILNTIRSMNNMACRPVFIKLQ